MKMTSINKNIDCSDICFTKDIKIDINTNECINSCKDHGYNHECNNICYNDCSEAINGNIFLYFNKCISKCPENYIPDINNICIL